jgi:uncharacterized membrane protein YoaK (UPF0700 family)
MFSITDSMSAYSRTNLVIWLALAMQAGILNVGGFLACGRFVSHVTGFAGHFGMEAARSQWLAALGMLTVPLFFLMGSILCAVLVDLRLKTQRRPLYEVTLGICSALIFILSGAGQVGFFGDFGKPLELQHDFTLLAILCLVCGIQNAMVTSVSKSIVRTTHLTGITTDLGIGIVRWLHRREHPQFGKEESKANVMRAGIIIFFGIGSMVGAWAFYNWEYLGFVIPGFISFGLFVKSLRRFRVFETK